MAELRCQTEGCIRRGRFEILYRCPNRKCGCQIIMKFCRRHAEERIPPGFKLLPSGEWQKIR
jgi:hypothetical protein